MRSKPRAALLCRSGKPIGGFKKTFTVIMFKIGWKGERCCDWLSILWAGLTRVFPSAATSDWLFFGGKPTSTNRVRTRPSLLPHLIMITDCSPSL